MPKVIISDLDPERVTNVRAGQEALFAVANGLSSVARLCPYCFKKLSILYPGHHGLARMKCPACGEDVICPPVTLRRSKA